jgi:hypothetical protein
MVLKFNTEPKSRPRRAGRDIVLAKATVGVFGWRSDWERLKAD